MKSLIFAGLLAFSASVFASPAPLVSTANQAAYWQNLSALCGKAFEGEIVKETEDDGFGVGQKLVMHVRYCSDTEIQIPFHIGEDASRTWIITNTGAGLMLKHDHRNKDGSYHVSTMYGGHTVDSGWPQLQSFPADAYSKELFVKQGIPASVDNTWQMMIYPQTFSYRLIRPAREFQVDFDLTKPVEPPEAPWGYGEQ
ncbi:hypothetical protein [Planctobacterium marinum]|uniref:Secreted protein n=1 Tax=Planctobacterium marinum TaxID=1631968 RepID=A0AA48KR96_9ALTE|nr:hypothetical protein MACH26_41470 [Planctobacterium marinum]